MTLHLRDALDAESDTVLSITLAAYGQYETAYPPEFWTPYRLNIVEQFTKENDAQKIVAARDGAIVGSVLLFPPPIPAAARVKRESLPEIRLLAVTPQARGLGVGGALLEECIRRARASGVPALGLHSMEVMTVAIGMYERAGFVRDPRADFQPTPAVLVMGYRLDFDAAHTPVHPT